MTAKTKYVVCVKNEDYPASLEVGKIHRTLPDIDPAKHSLLRIIDQSGEDYLYPGALFLPIEHCSHAVPPTALLPHLFGD